jgi:hypothetical protein
VQSGRIGAAFSYSPPSPDGTWDPLTHTRDTGGFFFSGEQRSHSEKDQSPPATAEVNRACHFPSIYSVMLRHRTLLR